MVKYRFTDGPPPPLSSLAKGPTRSGDLVSFPFLRLRISSSHRGRGWRQRPTAGPAPPTSRPTARRRREAGPEAGATRASRTDEMTRRLLGRNPATRQPARLGPPPAPPPQPPEGPCQIVAARRAVRSFPAAGRGG